MDMTGEQLIPLPQQRVWEALNDPAILKACIPGCETMEKISDTEYRVVMAAAVGPVKAKFNGKLLLSDLNPPQSYSLAFEGTGGAAGFGKGSSTVTLTPVEGGTQLSYTAHATVGGKLAQVGSRLIDGVARKMANDFFAKFNQAVAPPAASAAPATATAPAAAAASQSFAATADTVPRAVPVAAPARKSGVPTWAWILGAIIIVALALFFAKGTSGS